MNICISEKYDEKHRVIFKEYEDHHTEEFVYEENSERVIYKKEIYKDGTIKETFNSYNIDGTLESFRTEVNGEIVEQANYNIYNQTSSSKQIHIWFHDFEKSNLVGKDGTYSDVLTKIRLKRDVIHTIIPQFCSETYYILGYHIVLHLFDGETKIVTKQLINEVIEEHGEMPWYEMLIRGYFGPISKDQINRDFVIESDVSEDDYYKAIKDDDVKVFKKNKRVDYDILHDCAHYNSINIMKYCVEELNVPVDTLRGGTARNTPFKTACLNSSYECVKYLYEKGASMAYLDIELDHTERGIDDFMAMIKFLTENSIGFKYNPVFECACM